MKQRPPVVVNRHQICGQRVPPLMKSGEVCDLLRKSKPTLHRWVKSGDFPPPIKLSRSVHVWQREAVQDWLAEREAIG